MPMNTELAQQVLDYIRDNPEQHDQTQWGEKGTWRCGTAACFAGWTAILAGKAEWLGGEKGGYWLEEGVAEQARELLGVTVDQGDTLFDSGNTLEDIEGSLNRWSNGVVE